MTMNNYMAQLGAQLVDHGFAILPIQPGTRSRAYIAAKPGTTIRNGAGIASVTPRRIRSASGAIGPRPASALPQGA